MALSTNASEEIKKVTECQKVTSALRTRMDEDWSRYRLDSDMYTIPKKEGEWEPFITNRATTEGNKIVDYLSNARRKLWIPITDETETKRKSLTATEYLAVGCLYLADALNEDIPDYVPVQSALAFYRVHRGWSALRSLLREEEDGTLIPDDAVWDPRNTYWRVGRKRATWVCYKRYASKEQVVDEYKGWNGSPNANGMVEIHDVWDCSEPGKPAEEGVIIGTEYVKEPTVVRVGELELDYLPIRIKAGRSTPLIYDGKDDNIKLVGESYQANNRLMYAQESRLLSYKLTRAGQLAKSPRTGEFDGSQSNGMPPDTFEKDPYIKGRTIWLDKAKGQQLVEQMTPPNGSEIDSTLATTIGLESMGGLSPVAYGQVNQAMPAQGIDILAHQTLEVISAFKQGVEKDIIWLAQEKVRQYKNGEFSETELQGYDKSNNPFKIKVKPDDIDTNWRFECELIPDLLRDKSANLGLASQAVRDKLLSRQTARDQYNLVEDTDVEQEKIDKEDAEAVAQVKLWKMAIALVKDGKTVEAQIVLNQIMQMAQPPAPGRPQGGSPNQAGIPRPMPPGAQAAGMRMNPQIPEPISEAARLSQMGIAAPGGE